ncbi:iron-sulfur cluster assembly scaffold protein [Candidatus Dependentiae bacterium]
MSNEKLYQEELMEHYRFPKNRKNIHDPDFSSKQFNPSCGDKISIEGKIKKETDSSGSIIISELGFQGAGCVISQATASMLTQYCIGKSIDQVLNFNKDDIIKIIKLKLGPTRLRCALLSLEALKDALNSFKKEHK